jgi:hypothetical protein
MVYRIFQHKIELSKAVDAFNAGQIDETGLREKVEDYIFAEARSDFDIMTSDRDRRKIVYAKHADHVTRTDFFAYALARGKFSHDEIGRIPFDHGENPQIYIETYGMSQDLLVSREIMNLIYPTPIKTADSDDPHPVCDCGY